jgi:hypothetical protein
MSKPVYCAPKGSPTGQMVLVHIKYLEDNLGQLHGIDMNLFLRAMQQTFPCT